MLRGFNQRRSVFKQIKIAKISIESETSKARLNITSIMYASKTAAIESY